MKLAITDPLAEAMGLYVQETASEYLTVRTDTTTAFYNPYGFAHGGFLYTMGHITARNMAKMCLNRDMQVVQSDCLYLSKLFGGPITARAEVLSDYGPAVVCVVEIFDGAEHICFRQTLTLQNTVPEQCTLTKPKNPEEIAQKWDREGAPLCSYQQEAPYFDDLCHIFAPEVMDGVVCSTTDLFTDNCSDAGFVHQGAIFTCCDNCAAACVAIMQKKRPITISSTVHYLAPAAIGPVIAEGKLIHEGKGLSFYEIDAYDGYGRPVATTQFVMRCQDAPQLNH